MRRKEEEKLEMSPCPNYRFQNSLRTQLRIKIYGDSVLVAHWIPGGIRVKNSTDAPDIHQLWPWVGSALYNWRLPALPPHDHEDTPLDIHTAKTTDTEVVDPSTATTQ